MTTHNVSVGITVEPTIPTSVITYSHCDRINGIESYWHSTFAVVLFMLNEVQNPRFRRAPLCETTARPPPNTLKSLLLHASFLVNMPSFSKINAICHSGGKYRVRLELFLQAPSRYESITSRRVAASIRNPVCSANQTLNTSSVNQILLPVVVFPTSFVICSKASRIWWNLSRVSSSPDDVSGWYFMASCKNVWRTISGQESRGRPSTSNGLRVAAVVASADDEEEEDEEDDLCRRCGCWYCDGWWWSW